MTTLINDDLHAKLLSDSPNTDFIVINRTITRQLHIDLSACIAKHKANKRCVLILTTLGGDPHAGYRIARCLRHHFSEVRLLIPSLCKSAGTLIAIGANDLAIGDMGELGPLDIQVLKTGEILERGSGLDVTTALQQCLQHAQAVFFTFFKNSKQTLRVSPRLAAEFASSVTAGLLAPLYTQIDPLRLGEMQRAMAITLQYGTRLNGHTSNLKANALDKLTIDYPAHEFVIDRKEARELFQKVSPLSDNEQFACEKLWSIVGTPSEQGFGPVFILPKLPLEGETHGTNVKFLSSGGTAETVSQSGTARKDATPTRRKRKSSGTKNQ